MAVDMEELAQLDGLLELPVHLVEERLLLDPVIKADKEQRMAEMAETQTPITALPEAEVEEEQIFAEAEEQEEEVLEIRVAAFLNMEENPEKAA